MNDSELTELTTYRSEIDEIDNDIAELLIERFEIASKIAQFKRKNNLPIENNKREKEHLNAISMLSEAYTTELTRIFSAIYKNSKRIQRREMNLYLIGMPGCGKSRCGYAIANILCLPFADTDKIIMKEQGKSIDTIFDTLGESKFRDMETNVLNNLAAHGGTVVATGGGILTNPANIPIIRSSGFTVFLDRKLDQLLNQKLRNRPLIREGKDAIIRMYNERRGAYISNADYIDNPDSRGAIGRIISSYRRFID